VKTVQFGDAKYVGDPINAVKIFNEKEADELIVLDIDATVKNCAPDFGLIKKLAAECRMPLCYGGGVRTIEQAKAIIGLGVEKVALSAAVLEDPAIVTRIADEIGSQSVVVVLDVMKKITGNLYEIATHNAKRKTGRCPVEFSRELENLGVGEIVVNSISNDGLMKGYDVTLARQIREVVRVPITILGGAGTLKDIGNLIENLGVVGAAAGSIFVFKGTYRAVLISYPGQAQKDEIIRFALSL
jgi:cyclase